MEQLVEVKYARARTYFEAQHWDEAAMAFKDIADHHADRDVGIYAAQLYLESINVLGANMNPPRPVCYDDMATAPFRSSSRTIAKATRARRTPTSAWS
ncbi:MAG: hypothetical protein U0235_21015 [Polyangiaceae bacterium]